MSGLKISVNICIFFKLKPSLNRDFVSLIKQMISLRKKNDVIEVQIFFVCQTILYLSSGSSTAGPRVTRRTSSVGRVWVGGRGGCGWC